MLATVTWYATRASGVVAYLLLAASVVFGLTLSSRIHGSRPSRPWVLDVHRMLGGLAVLLTLTHVAAILLDSYTSFDAADVLMPFASGWNPAAVAAGVVALWLLAAVELTSLARDRLSNRVWRRVHMLSFAVFLLTTVHFVAAGTDASSPVMLVSLLALVSTVVALTALRAGKHLVRTAPPRATRAPTAPSGARPGAAPRHASPPPPPRRRRAEELVNPR
jgi:DMSO/TMAO reductase YedYZ heme-binding membrane subunit